MVVAKAAAPHRAAARRAMRPRSAIVVLLVRAFPLRVLSVAHSAPADARPGERRITEDGADLHLIGSGQLLQTLVAHGLIDEYHLMIDPLVVGGGKRLFHDDGVRRSLRLVDSQVTGTGVILAIYTPAPDPDPPQA